MSQETAKPSDEPVDKQAAVTPEPPPELLEAAERNDPEAFYQLGKQYLQSMPPDPGKAFVLMQKAVELGSPGGLNGLGTCYLYGYGVEQDFAKVVELSIMILA